MFKFNESTLSHMPFVAYREFPDFELKCFCCLLVGGKWKLHYLDKNEWKRLDTGLPYDATECSPTAEYEPSSDTWKVSFIAGGHETDRRFYLYKIEDLKNPIAEKITEADVGFIWKNKVIYGGRKGPIFIAGDRKPQALSFRNVEYLYRVSYNPDNPHELLISGQYGTGELFSWVCNPVAKILQEISVGTEAAYKVAFAKGKLYYAQRINNAGFEDRRIIEAEDFELEALDYDAFVSKGISDVEPTVLQMMKNLSHSMVGWAKSGFKVASNETLLMRKNICSSCKFWNSSARMSMGKCLKCGCTSAKLRLANEKCPDGKW